MVKSSDWHQTAWVWIPAPSLCDLSFPTCEMGTRNVSMPHWLVDSIERHTQCEVLSTEHTGSTQYVLWLLLGVFEKRIILVWLKYESQGCCRETGPEKRVLNLITKDFKCQDKLSRLYSPSPWISILSDLISFITSILECLLSYTEMKLIENEIYWHIVSKNQYNAPSVI